jgi:hypothetical protein
LALQGRDELDEPLSAEQYPERRVALESGVDGVCSVVTKKEDEELSAHYGRGVLRSEGFYIPVSQLAHINAEDLYM